MSSFELPWLLDLARAGALSRIGWMARAEGRPQYGQVGAASEKAPKQSEQMTMAICAGPDLATPQSSRTKQRVSRVGTKRKPRLDTAGALHKSRHAPTMIPGSTKVKANDVNDYCDETAHRVVAASA